MALSRLLKAVCLVMPVFLFACGEKDKSEVVFSIQLNQADYPWLKTKKIFVDAGHGGTAASDKFRNGPFGVTEESVNLRVALFLEDMLKQTGAEVFMSRRSDIDISLDERSRMVHDTQPDILVSIHHNGTIRAADGVNYTCVLVRGSHELYPASIDLANLLKDELAKVVDAPALVISDYSIFQETGSRLLRKTESVCPGVIGEGGFFSDPGQALSMKDPDYNKKEAEAYFKAISNYFKNGLPTGQIYFSCPVRNGAIKVKAPSIFLNLDPGIEDAGIKEDSIFITLDDIPLSVTKWRENIFRVNYGYMIYSGGHKLRFHFRNTLGQSSMVMYSSFIVGVNAGDYAALISNGRNLLNKGNTAEGLKMLLSANSMEITGPNSAGLIKDIAGGFAKLGLKDAAEYYYLALRHFYPDGTSAGNSAWYPAKYHGKSVPIIFGTVP